MGQIRTGRRAPRPVGGFVQYATRPLASRLPRLAPPDPPSPATDHVHAAERNRFPGALPAFRTL